MRNLKLALALAGMTLASAAQADGHAESWTLNADTSVVGFGSIKADDTGEAHIFQRLSGSVAADGTAQVEIDLTSVETYIDIRNERMIEHVFGEAATATLKASVDMEAMGALGVGDGMVTEIDGDLAFLGQDIPVFLDVFVMRLDQENIMVTTNSMLFVSTEELGVNDGIDTLMELASLPGITRAAPVTFRLMFTSDSAES